MSKKEFKSLVYGLIIVLFSWVGSLNLIDQGYFYLTGTPYTISVEWGLLLVVSFTAITIASVVRNPDFILDAKANFLESFEDFKFMRGKK